MNIFEGNEFDGILILRFKSEGDALKWHQTGNDDLVIPKFIEFKGGSRPNPEYYGAPYEERILLGRNAHKRLIANA